MRALTTTNGIRSSMAFLVVSLLGLGGTGSRPAVAQTRQSGTHSNVARWKRRIVLREKKSRNLIQILTKVRGATQENMLFRLGSLYVSQMKDWQRLEAHKHNHQMEQWLRSCKDTPKRCSKPPRKNQVNSRKMRLSAISIFRRLIRSFPRSALAPEAYFEIAKVVEGKTNPREAIRIYTLLTRRYPGSYWSSQAHTKLGAYSFQKNKVLWAMNHYKQAAKQSWKLLNNKRHEPHQTVKLRFTYLNALYNLAWLDYNVGEYRKSLKRFLHVHVTSKRKTFQAPVIKTLGLKAIKSTVLLASKMDFVVEGWKLWKKHTNHLFAHRSMEKLGSLYMNQGNFVRAIQTYQWLATHTQRGKLSSTHKLAPLYFLKLCRAASRIHAPIKLQRYYTQLLQYVRPKHRWQITWKSNAKVIHRVYNSTLTFVMDEAARNHKLGTTSRSKRFRAQAMNLAEFIYRQIDKVYPHGPYEEEVQYYLANLLVHKAISTRKTSTNKHKAIQHLREARRLFKKLITNKANYVKKATQGHQQCLKLEQLWKTTKAKSR